MCVCLCTYPSHHCGEHFRDVYLIIILSSVQFPRKERLRQTIQANVLLKSPVLRLQQRKMRLGKSKNKYKMVHFCAGETALQET